MKKRHKRKPAEELPPFKPGDLPGFQPPQPPAHFGKREIDPFSELFDEDHLDYLENLTRSPKERHRTDLLVIGLLLLLCALLALAIILVLRHYHLSRPSKAALALIWSNLRIVPEPGPGII